MVHTFEVRETPLIKAVTKTDVHLSPPGLRELPSTHGQPRYISASTNENGLSDSDSHGRYALLTRQGVSQRTSLYTSRTQTLVN